MPPMNKNNANNSNTLPVSITFDFLKKPQAKNAKREDTNDQAAQTESVKKNKTLKQSLSFDSRANKESAANSKHEIGLIRKMKKQLS
jgi:hypothetical protein